MRAEFPQAQRINTFAVNMSMAAGGGDIAGKAMSQALGLRLTNAQGNRILQLRRQGCSYSHLQPYSEWATFVGEFQPLWESFVAKFQPEVVTRIAVRYINRIVVPQGVDLDEWMVITPRLPASVAAHVEGFFLQAQLPQADISPDCKAVINSGLEGASSPDEMTVLLDIDVFLENQQVVPSDPKVWTLLGQLRDRKNDIFEAGITDHVRERIV